MSTTDPDDRIRTELLPGERLLWTGRPDPRVLFTAFDAFLVPFSLLWCGFAIFWTSTALQSGGPGFALFGLFFVAIGLYFVFGRFIYKTNRKRATRYAVTDRRVLSLTGSHAASQIPTHGQPITTRRRRNHLSVVIGPPPQLQQAIYANTGLDFFVRPTGTIGLWDVSNSAPLLAALREAQAH